MHPQSVKVRTAQVQKKQIDECTDSTITSAHRGRTTPTESGSHRSQPAHQLITLQLLLSMGINGDEYAFHDKR